MLFLQRKRAAPCGAAKSDREEVRSEQEDCGQNENNYGREWLTLYFDSVEQ